MTERSGSGPALLAFIGTPNCGKSTLFNRLTGLQQKVSNFPGVTVEPKKGRVFIDRTHVDLVDLPGLYSLHAMSPDEQFTIDVLRGHSSLMARPDACIVVIDGTNMEKGLSLYSQVAELGLPCIVVITMIDTLKAHGAILDDIGLEHKLGVDILTVVGTKGTGVAELRDHLVHTHLFRTPKPVVEPDAGIEARVLWARSCRQDILREVQHDALSAKLDNILLNPFSGTLVFISVMALFFTAIFSWAEPLMRLIESGVGVIQDLVIHSTQPGLLQNFLTKGIVGGVGSVIVFLPQIILLMLFVTFLEDCGYLARAAFIVDRFMGVFGLQGRSFIPLLGSFACAIPGIMSARLIPSAKDRMATILVAPLMTCSARLPVYSLLIAAFIPGTLILGVASLQSIVLAGLYLLGLLTGLLMAFVFRKTLFRSDKLHFLIEFPPYRMPSLKTLCITVWMKSKDFVETAGTIILFISIILWALTEFPSSGNNAQLQLEQSYAGQLGKVLQPVFAPLGFDWKVTIGVIGSFAARETFVSVMGQLYATDVQTSDATLREVLHASMSLPAALSVLIFYVFALQCMSTIAIIRRETGSWSWSALAFTYTFVLAYSASWLTFHLSRWLCG